MEEDRRDFDIMRTYARAWQTEIVMYHLFGIPLWFPISLRQAGFFMVGLFFMFLFTKVVPGIKSIPLLGDSLVLYGVVPFLIMKFFTQMTLDGKSPHVFIKDQMVYILENKRYNMYKPIESRSRMKYTSNIGYRIIKRMSSIDYRLLKREGR